MANDREHESSPDVQQPDPGQGVDLSQVDDETLLRALEESRIVIRPDGKVVIENLTEDLLGVARALNPDQAPACDVPDAPPSAGDQLPPAADPTTMRAVVIREFGGPEVLALRTVPVPSPPPGYVRVAVRASALNRADLLQRRGLYPAPAGVAADIPGLEFAGEVTTLGEGSDRFQPGARVMGLSAGASHAEYVIAHERSLIAVPEALSWEEAAAVPEAFMTAFDALVAQAGLTHGDRVLVHAVGSGVGTAALQIAKAYGATVAGTSRTPDKLRRATELGLDVAIDTSGGFGPEQADALLQAMQGGADIVVDLIGGSYLEGNLRALAHGGHMVTLGLMGGLSGKLDLARVMRQRITLTGSTLRARPLEQKIALARTFEKQIMPAFARGTMAPCVDRAMPMTAVAEAHQLLEDNATFGKIVLTW